MAKHKEKEFKEFQISERKKIGSGLTNAPVWVMQKAGKRIWNARQKRTWKKIDIKERYEKHEKKQAKVKIKKGSHGKWKKQ
ncbi:MAG: hypothetical protein GX950_02960 [Candidatus Diapherotrites archaeon]|jgi:hypothetical protein|uniref:50S ribosomal protein L39e n=1 Tax=Candidatus Iainarchaeum sp. TaxID=3101447 RepID=A0A7K4BZW3_9ARCH|nr:hypothetical protein [Candidatus Diapherotrites archaeon]